MSFAVPSIDILSGNAVRLRQGKKETSEILGNPLQLAEKYRKLGFLYLHVVDLDAAFGGDSQFELLEKIAKSCGSMTLQWGGGMRRAALAARAFEAGAARVIFSTALFTAPEEVAAAVRKFGPEKIWASLDFAGNPPVARIRGWTEGQGATVGKSIEAAEKCGVGGAVLSSIDRDGTMEGPDLDLARQFASGWKKPFWLSGGMRDARDAKDSFAAGAQGTIFGRALYGKNDLEELACLQQE